MCLLFLYNIIYGNQLSNSFQSQKQTKQDLRNYSLGLDQEKSGSNPNTGKKKKKAYSVAIHRPWALNTLHSYYNRGGNHAIFLAHRKTNWMNQNFWNIEANSSVL